MLPFVVARTRWGREGRRTNAFAFALWSVSYEDERDGPNGGRTRICELSTSVGAARAVAVMSART